MGSEMCIRDRDFPFDIRVGNVYIRGGTRTEDGKGKFRRPKIGANAIQTLVMKSVEDIMRKQNLQDDDKLTTRLREAKLAPGPNSKDFPVRELLLTQLRDTRHKTSTNKYNKDTIIDKIWTNVNRIAQSSIKSLMVSLSKLIFRTSRSVSYTHLTLPTNREV